MMLGAERQSHNAPSGHDYGPVRCFAGPGPRGGWGIAAENAGADLSGGLIYGCRYREQAGIKEFRGRLRRSGGTADKSDAPPGNGEGLLPGGGAEYQADGGKAGDSLKET